MLKIAYSDYLSKLSDPDISEEELATYVLIEKGQGGFDFNIKPNPETVDIEGISDDEGLMDLGNGLARVRRTLKFRTRLVNKPDMPVVIVEGDSHMQFPILIKETVDHLSENYNIYCMSAAGDTAENMLGSKLGKGKNEYLRGLKRYADRAKAFIISAAGNDFLGSVVATKQSNLHLILNDFNGDTNDVEGHINSKEFGKKVDMLKKLYSDMITNINSEPGLTQLPIILYGYDYPFPYPAESGEHRNPKYADKDGWLGKPFSQRGIEDSKLRRKIIFYLIDTLYDLLDELTANPAHNNVHVVDCRGAMPTVDLWNDEIHGNSEGFKFVADRFHKTLDDLIN